MAWLLQARQAARTALDAALAVPRKWSRRNDLSGWSLVMSDLALDIEDRVLVRAYDLLRAAEGWTAETLVVTHCMKVVPPGPACRHYEEMVQAGRASVRADAGAKVLRGAVPSG